VEWSPATGRPLAQFEVDPVVAYTLFSHINKKDSTLPGSYFGKNLDEQPRY
jgi:hypothetical protein